MDVSQGEKADVAIAGGGVAGLLLAAKLAQTLGPAFRVRLHDPALGSRATSDNIRAYAISAFGCRQFQALGIWPALAKAAQPITRMIVTDSGTEEPVRPVFLRFEGEIAPDEPFAHMIGESLMLATLCDVARENGVVISSTAVTGSNSGRARRQVILSDKSEIKVSLLVAADGRRSRLREQSGIPFYGWDYRQNGIVVPVRHQRGHAGCAEEHFLPAGPFAILPMRAADGSDMESSIVWTESRERAQHLCSLDQGHFGEVLQEMFGLHLGKVEALAAPETYPLSLGLARHFHNDRLALLGDAAHVIHPLAGQGLNLALKDAAMLADLIVEQARNGLDIGETGLLERYDRDRRFDTAAMAVTTDLLNRLFSNDIGAIRAIRDLGLGVVDRMPPLKRFLIGQASGVTQESARELAG